MNRRALWLEELQLLSLRFSNYGISPDLAGLTRADARGLWLFLCRIAGGADAG